MTMTATIIDRKKSAINNQSSQSNRNSHNQRPQQPQSMTATAQATTNNCNSHNPRCGGHNQRLRQQQLQRPTERARDCKNHHKNRQHRIFLLS